MFLTLLVREKLGCWQPLSQSDPTNYLAHFFCRHVPEVSGHLGKRKVMHWKHIKGGRSGSWKKKKKNIKTNPETPWKGKLIGCYWGCSAILKPGNNLFSICRKGGRHGGHLTFQNSEGHQLAIYGIDEMEWDSVEGAEKGGQQSGEGQMKKCEAGGKSQKACGYRDHRNSGLLSREWTS